MAEVYEVEQILRMKKRPGKSNLYYIRWARYGPEEDSWEPEENLLDCGEVLEAFKKSQATPAAKSSTKPLTRSSGRTSTMAATSAGRISTSVTKNTSSSTVTENTRTVTQRTTTVTSATRTNFETPAILQRPMLRSRGRLNFDSGDSGTVHKVTQSVTSTSLPASGGRRWDVVLCLFILSVIFVAAAIVLQKWEI